MTPHLYAWAACLIIWQAAVAQQPDIYWYAPTVGHSPATQIPAYQKVELGLSLDTTFSSAIDRYRYDGVRGLLTGPSGQRRDVLIFYYEPLRYGDIQARLVYSHVRVEEPADQVWLPAIEGRGQRDRWRMRFVLDEPGPWQLQLLRGSDRRPWGKPVSLTCVPSNDRGYLRFPPGKKYLQDASGETCFLLGHNLSYYHTEELPAPYHDLRPNGDFDYSRNTRWQYEHFLDQLSNHHGEQLGGNYCRIVLAPWSFDLEVETAGDYDACQNRAFDLDQVIEMAAERGVYVNLSAYDHVFFNDNPDPARHFPYYFWENHPYRKLEGVSEVVDAFTDPEARAMARQRFRYLTARYGYSPHLLCIETFNEGDNFLGGNRRYYQKNKAAIDAWHVEMVTYMRQFSPQFLLTSSTMDPMSLHPVWENDATDFGTFHVYLNLKNGAYYLNIISRWLSESFTQPVLLGEYGFRAVASSGQECAHDISTPDAATFSVMHNGLWGTAFAGGCGAASIWFYQIYHAHWLKPGGYQFYLPLRAFMEGEPLSDMRPLSNACSSRFLPKNNFRLGHPDGCYPRRLGEERHRGRGLYTSNDDNIEAFALAGSDRLIGWVHNKNHYWYDLRHTATKDFQTGTDCESLNWPDGAKGTDVGIDPYRYPLYLETLTVPVERPGRYELTWWHTYPAHDYSGDEAPQGGVGIIDNLTKTLTVKGTTATLDIPPLVAVEKGKGSQSPDYGFKLVRIAD